MSNSPGEQGAAVTRLRSRMTLPARLVDEAVSVIPREVCINMYIAMERSADICIQRLIEAFSEGTDPGRVFLVWR